MNTIFDWWLIPSDKGWVIQGNCCHRQITTSRIINLIHVEDGGIIAETLNSKYALRFPKTSSELPLVNNLKGRL